MGKLDMKPGIADRDPLIPEEPLPEPGPSARDHPYSRLIAHFVAEFILRSAEGIAQLFDHDLESAMLFMSIAIRNSEKVMNDPKMREKYGSYKVALPGDDVLLISRMALARATGLPRETVRRKVAKLIAKGWVIEKEGGLHIRPDLNRDARYIAVLEPQAQNLRRLFSVLLSSGALNPTT
jgi:hypothetical protein